MTKKKHEQPILVPVDLSPSSEAAFAFAADLAHRLDLPLVVLHVVHDPGEAPGYYHVKGQKKILRRLEDVAREMLEAFVSRMKEKVPHGAPPDRAQQQLVVGLPVTRILEVIEKLNPYMVVMASAGRTGLAHALLGSKAEQVVRLSPAPVTIVKYREED